MCGLEIKSAVEDDDGEWRCVVSQQSPSEHFTEVAKIRVTVKDLINSTESNKFEFKENTAIHNNSFSMEGSSHEVIKEISPELKPFANKYDTNVRHINCTRNNLKTVGDVKYEEDGTGENYQTWYSISGIKSWAIFACIVFVVTTLVLLVVVKIINHFKKQ